MDNKKILLIEDDPEIRKVVEVNLRLQGLTAQSCDDGQQGLELALQGDYSLVILDLQLPSLDGLEVCQRLRAEKPFLPILLNTCHNI